MDISKPAVAKNTDNVTEDGISDDVFDDRFDGRQIRSWFAGKPKVLHEFVGIQPIACWQLFEASHLGDHHTICPF